MAKKICSNCGYIDDGKNMNFCAKCGGQMIEYKKPPKEVIPKNEDEPESVEDDADNTNSNIHESYRARQR